MKKVLFRSGALTQSGYGVHARQVFRYLLDVCNQNNHELSTQILPWGDTPWILNSDAHNGLIGEIMSRSVTVDEGKSKNLYDVAVQLQLPNEWNPNLGKVNIGVTAGIESNICQPNWISSCLKMDTVIVPSSFSKKVFIDTEKDSVIKSSLDEKIIVIPECFPDLFIKDKCDKKNFDCDNFSQNNILIVGQITGLNAENDRKNLFYTIRWLCEALSEKEDWGIIIKTNAARNTNIDRQIVLNMLKQLIKEIRPTRPNPKIHVLHGSLSEEELLSLYRDERVKLFVSLTRGEGFGLPLLEAASTGLPIIATDWSGHLDFLKDQFMKVPYELISVPETHLKNGIFAKNSKWASPSRSQFIKMLNSFININQYRATQLNKSKKLQSRVQNDYKFETVQKTYEKEIGKYFV